MVARLKAGVTNVLVATCIAEEGLDVGEVDLIVHFDVVTSSTRSVQRNGRTGRKRPGRVVQLFVPSEKSKISRAKSQARSMKKALLGGGTGKGKKTLRFSAVDPEGPLFPPNTRPMMREIHVPSQPKLEPKDVSNCSTSPSSSCCYHCLLLFLLPLSLSCYCSAVLYNSPRRYFATPSLRLALSLLLLLLQVAGFSSKRKGVVKVSLGKRRASPWTDDDDDDEEGGGRPRMPGL